MPAENRPGEKLLKACPGWIRPYAIIAAYTGMRRREICGLKREHAFPAGAITQLSSCSVIPNWPQFSLGLFRTLW